MDTYIHPAQFCITVLAKNIPDHVSASELQIIMQNHSVQYKLDSDIGNTVQYKLIRLKKVLKKSMYTIFSSMTEWSGTGTWQIMYIVNEK